MKTIDLPSGKKAEVGEFKGKHIRKAQRIAGTETDKMTFAMIALTTTVDGEQVLMEDLDEMDGFDVLVLLEEFSGNFSFPAKQ